MNNCKYLKVEVIQGIVHLFCTNESIKKANKSKSNKIPCIKHENCGKCKSDIKE